MGGFGRLFHCSGVCGINGCSAVGIAGESVKGLNAVKCGFRGVFSQPDEAFPPLKQPWRASALGGRSHSGNADPTQFLKKAVKHPQVFALDTEETTRTAVWPKSAEFVQRGFS